MSRGAYALHGLDDLEAIGSSFRIINNNYISSLKGLNNNLRVEGDWLLINNPKLNYCESIPLCNHLSEGKEYIIADNAAGCDDVSDIACLENSITGFVFHDFEDDGVYNAQTDGLLSNVMISFEGEQDIFITGENGFYRKHLLEGDLFGATAYPRQGLTFTTSDSYQIDSFIPNVTSVDTFDFGMKTNQVDILYNIGVTNSLFICNREFDVSLNIENISSQVGQGYLTLQYSPEITLDPTFIDFDNHDLDNRLVTIKFDSLYPFFNLKRNISFIAPTADEIENTDMFVLVTIYQAEGNEVVQAGEQKLSLGLLCSYDPNDKLVSSTDGTGKIRVGELTDELIYTIRFQNTGNFYAEDVRITDDISDNLNLSTFRFIDASHPVEINLDDRQLTFMFEDIYLIDSTTSFLESQGYVTFAIQPYSYELGEEFNNEANIYFDLNEPILTNTIESEVYDPTVGVDDAFSHEVVISPIPASNELNIRHNIKNGPIILRISNSLGQLKWYQENLSSYHTIETTSFQSGIYYLEILSDNKVIGVKKIMIVD